MKIYLDTIGCRLNQAEIERYARQFHAAGHELVATAHEADLAVVNTCSVTSAAASDSRHKIRQAVRLGAGEVIVTGCWSSLKPQAAADLPGVSQVVPNENKDALVAQVLGLPPESYDLEPVERQTVPGARLRTRAFMKVQDGCDNRCTFCVTTLARGVGRSHTIPQIMADVQSVLQSQEDGSQAREIVLTGVHLGSWGHDLQPAQRLPDLVRAILSETGVPRLRLSSLEPWDLDEDFFELWQDPRLCRHLHLPLQSGSAATLRRMARKTNPESFAALVAAARKAIPDLAITTDVIAGFPGESEDEFQQSIAFVRAMQFAGGHVFTYSARQGTAAARMPNQVPHELRKARNAQLRAVLAESGADYARRFLDTTLAVLWESATAMGPSGWRMSGLTDNYLRVMAEAPRQMWNQITSVRLLRQTPEGIEGQVLA